MRTFHKNILICLSVCYSMVLIMVLLGSCSKNKKEVVSAVASELEKLSAATQSQTADSENNAPATALDSSDTPVSPANTSTSTIDNNTIAFQAKYGPVQHWNTLAFSQEDTKIQKLEADQEISLLSLIERNAHVTNNSSFVVTPYDTVIGKLQDTRTGDAHDKAIYDLWKQVIEQLKAGSLGKNIQQYIIEFEIPVISRQIADANKYGSSITSFRTGEVAIESPNVRYMKTRIFAKFSDFNSVAELIVYFLAVDGRWYISAIEGDLNDLLIAYQNPGQFEPTGTLGVTQGL